MATGSHTATTGSAVHPSQTSRPAPDRSSPYLRGSRTIVVRRHPAAVPPRRSAVPRRIAVALLAVTALIAGCSDGRDAPGAAATTAPATTAPAGAPTTAGATSTTATATTRAQPVRYTFPLRGCRYDFSRGHHDYPATDIFAARGCVVVAPVAGRIDEISTTDRWTPASNRGSDRGGLSVSVVGVDGVRYYGSHLSALATGVRPGARVTAGRELGRVGNTGSAQVTPPHLHFGLSWPTKPGIWWIRRGVVDPYPFLTSWRRGGDLSPVAAVRSARARAGAATPPCSAAC
jgi:peptidoglycan LD-endopeptidase LytH